MAMLEGTNPGIRLSEILGLDPGLVSDIRIEVSPGDAVMAQVRLYVSKDQMESVYTLLGALRVEGPKAVVKE